MRATPFMLQQPLVFLDLETTGVSAAHDCIIEIGPCEVGGEPRHRALGDARVIREFLRRFVPACSPAEGWRMPSASNWAPWPLSAEGRKPRISRCHGAVAHR